MSDPEVHFWASGMLRAQAQLYLLDLCGSDSQNYTEREEGVTCERCLAALRAGSGLTIEAGYAGPPSALGSSGPVIFVESPSVAEQVRAAVLKDRREIFIELLPYLTVRGYAVSYERTLELSALIQDRK